MTQAVEVSKAFETVYGRKPRVFRAPGRVNLIGEHTDYNDGFVMPAAIEFSTWVAAAARPDRKLAIYSENFSESREFPLDDPEAKGQKHWSDYVRGVAVALERSGHRVSGADLYIRGEVPIGSGLSSSAAIEVSTALALLAISGISLDPKQIALLGQRAENEFVGMRCGIMDQFISCHGQANHALMLDCRSLDYRLLPLPPSVRLVICNTMVHHALAGGEYNKRRADCEAGVKHLAQFLPGIKALRDVTVPQLERYGNGLPEVVYRRCRHVVSEDGRMEQAAVALQSGALATFGELMYASHASLRIDYEVSCQELDIMVDLASNVKGVCGARMTGGGFGGCTINLVEAGHVDEFKATVAAGYEKATGKTPVIYVTSAVNGAEEVTPA
jgi:galactokinase